MPEINKNWIDAQLSEAKTPALTANYIRHLLVSWSEITDVIPDNVAKSVVEQFSKLALGHTLIERKQGTETWVQAEPGRIKVGDEVLVRSDAFTGELATIHNGRRGRVVAVRYGDIIVNSTDGIEPFLNGTHYSPIHLQKLILTDD